MGEKPPISAESERLDSKTLEELCLNVGTLATVYLKPVQQVFRAARPKRLASSPALQAPADDAMNGGAFTIPVSKLLASSPGQATAATTEPSAANAGKPDLNAAVNAADIYFAGVGSQQMAAMNLNGANDAIGGAAPQTQYVVNQNNQQAYQPQAAGGTATGELLLI